MSAVRRTLRRWMIRALSKAHLAAYRVSRGRVLGSVAGMPVLLLTTTGRRSGKARTTPLTFFRDATDLVVIASNGGADRSPDWSLNLQQTPRAIVEIGTDRLVVTARRGVATGTRPAVGRGHGDVRRLRPLPGTDNATDTCRPSHTRRPAGLTASLRPTEAVLRGFPTPFVESRTASCYSRTPFSAPAPERPKHIRPDGVRVTGNRSACGFGLGPRRLAGPRSGCLLRRARRNRPSGLRAPLLARHARRGRSRLGSHGAAFPAG